MHPALILIPVAALLLGPRYLVQRVLKQHNRNAYELSHSGSEVARELLDHHRLDNVLVEQTDVADHYDPIAKAVRLNRDKYDRKSLTAVTTAAHEVGHALQDADGFPPFVWRSRLVRVAQVTGEVGSVMIIAVPIAALLTRNPVPTAVVGIAALGMLGTGVAAQLAALPTELDASFNRALPMLKEGYIDESQGVAARKILMAASFTYVASSLAAVLNIWPWLGRPVLGPRTAPAPPAPVRPAPRALALEAVPVRGRPGFRKATAPRLESRVRRSSRTGTTEALVRMVAKPVVRAWLTLARA
jgi:Zn-dependent membrane protease YugP